MSGHSKWHSIKHKKGAIDAKRGWMFHKKGYIAIEKSKADEETLMTLAIDAGADDFSNDEALYEIYTSPEAFERVLTAVKAKGIQPETAEISMIPQTYVKVEGKAV